MDNISCILLSYEPSEFIGSKGEKVSLNKLTFLENESNKIHTFYFSDVKINDFEISPTDTISWVGDEIEIGVVFQLTAEFKQVNGNQYKRVITAVKREILE